MRVGTRRQRGLHPGQLIWGRAQPPLNMPSGGNRQNKEAVEKLSFASDVPTSWRVIACLSVTGTSLQSDVYVVRALPLRGPWGDQLNAASLWYGCWTGL